MVYSSAAAPCIEANAAATSATNYRTIFDLLSLNLRIEIVIYFVNFEMRSLRSDLSRRDLNNHLTARTLDFFYVTNLPFIGNCAD